MLKRFLIFEAKELSMMRSLSKEKSWHAHCRELEVKDEEEHED